MSSLHSGFNQETFLSWKQNTIYDQKPGMWPCPGASSTGEAGPCKRNPKQMGFGCSKIHLCLNNTKFHSVGTLLQLHGHNGDSIIIKCHLASLTREKAFLLLCLSLSCDCRPSSLMTLHLCSIKLVSEQSHPRPLLPCPSSRFLLPSTKGC